MANFGCTCKSSCIGLAIVASIIIGVITGILSYTAVITITPAFLWVLLGIAVVYLAIIVIATPFFRGRGLRYCICRVVSALLTGILGTILTSIILLGVSFAATSIIGTIIGALLLGFFTLTITSAACLIKCSAGCDDENDL